MRGNSGVYLFRALEGNLYKIGASDSILARRKAVSLTQRRCVLVHVIATNDKFHLEAYLHRVFVRKLHHEERHREWFNLPIEDVHRLLMLDYVEMLRKKPVDKAVQAFLEGKAPFDRRKVPEGNGVPL